MANSEDLARAIDAAAVNYEDVERLLRGTAFPVRRVDDEQESERVLLGALATGRTCESAHVCVCLRAYVYVCTHGMHT